MNKQSRILIADEHEIEREGVRVLIEREAAWKVCGVAENGRAAVALVLKLKPDAIVLDLKMADLDGIEAMKQIKQAVPETEILVLSAHESEELIEQVFESGAKSFVRKADADRFLVPALKSILDHKTFLTEKVSAMLLSRVFNVGTGRKKPSRAMEKLTAREREIVRLLAEGKSNREIALVLDISVRTGETHRARVMRKLGLRSLADVVRYAIRNGIVEA